MLPKTSAAIINLTKREFITASFDGRLSSMRRCANIRRMKPDVILSVVMPAYNERETVGTVIRRILTEIPLNLELIVVDDGSTDGTGAILDEIAAKDERIQVIHKPNGGKTSA